MSAERTDSVEPEADQIAAVLERRSAGLVMRVDASDPGVVEQRAEVARAISH